MFHRAKDVDRSSGEWSTVGSDMSVVIEKRDRSQSAQVSQKFSIKCSCYRTQYFSKDKMQTVPILAMYARWDAALVSVFFCHFVSRKYLQKYTQISEHLATWYFRFRTWSDFFTFNPETHLQSSFQWSFQSHLIIKKNSTHIFLNPSFYPLKWLLGIRNTLTLLSDSLCTSLRQFQRTTNSRSTPLWYRARKLAVSQL